MHTKLSLIWFCQLYVLSVWWAFYEETPMCVCVRTHICMCVCVCVCVCVFVGLSARKHILKSSSKIFMSCRWVCEMIHIHCFVVTDNVGAMVQYPRSLPLHTAGGFTAALYLLGLCWRHHHVHQISYVKWASVSQVQGIHIVAYC